MGKCPRQHLFRYFHRDEDWELKARWLSELITLEMLAGRVVDEQIDKALNAWREDRRLITTLADEAVSAFRNRMAGSQKEVAKLKAGKAPTTNAAPLLHHYYGLEVRPHDVANMEERVRLSTENFNNSELFEKIKKTRISGWMQARVPGVKNVEEFEVEGVTVYAQIDFSAAVKEKVYIWDFKSGRESDQASDSAEAQLAIYALWANKRKKASVKLENVRVQAVFLASPPLSTPKIVSAEQAESMSRNIRIQHEQELSMLEFAEVRRKRELYRANPENFPARPTPELCLFCKYREICPDSVET